MSAGTAVGGGVGRGVVRALAAPFAWVANARGRLRFVLLAAECLAAALTGTAVWWGVGLWGVPDAGEPFAADALYVTSMPADRNAYVVYVEAGRRLVPLREVEGAMSRRGESGLQFSAGARAGEWLDANGEALAQFRKGSAMPEAEPFDPAAPPPGRPGLGRGVPHPLAELVRLALLDAERETGRGDAAAAWGDLIAVLRAARLVNRHADQFDRQAVRAWRWEVLKAVPKWVALPTTDGARLRRALDDVLALDALPADDVYTLKVQYLEAVWSLGEFDGGNDDPVRFADLQLPDTVAPAFFRFRWALEREPERSRRLARLAFANWLAHFETPPDRRGKPAVKLVFPFWGDTCRLDFYDPGPDAPAAARALSPRDLARQVGRSRLAKRTLTRSVHWLKELRDQERRDQRALVIGLAEALYKREQGKAPQSTADLIGPYLKALPPDGSAELDEGTPNADD